MGFSTAARAFCYLVSAFSLFVFGFVSAQPLDDAAPDVIPEQTLTSGYDFGETPAFSLKAGLSVLADYSSFSQDDASVFQVGEQENQWEARSARLMLRGTIGRSGMKYLFASEFKGFDPDREKLWDVTDASIFIPLNRPDAVLYLGKTKQTFSYEMVGDSANLPHSERVLSPFFVSRDVGIKFARVYGEDQRLTFSAGVFNDFLTSEGDAKDNGTDISARGTGLLWYDNDGTRFLHLGLALRRTESEGGVLRYRGRPESNVTDYFVDTGELSADHALHTGLELLWNEGPFSILAEYAHAAVDDANDSRFSGYYVTGSWVVTGETRPYDRSVGYARRIHPNGPYGAVELVLRYAEIDLDDGAVQGGSFERVFAGVNWWATARWKLGAGVGRTSLDRFGTTGDTDSSLGRFQWIY